MSESSKTKIEEILAVLNILYIGTDKKQGFKIKEYVSKIKEIYNLDVDRRRVAQILNDLYEINRENPLYLPFFEINTPLSGKSQLYADRGDLKKAALMIKAIKYSPVITQKETDELIKTINMYFTDNEIEEIKKCM